MTPPFEPPRPGAKVEVVPGPRGPKGDAGDPTELLAAIEPGEALSKDEGGNPTSLGPVALTTEANTFSEDQTFAGKLSHTGAEVSLLGAGTSLRIPLAANAEIVADDVVGVGSENLVGVALNPKISGDFTGIAGSDPGFWWGLNLFATVDDDVEGITTPHGALIELAVKQKTGTISGVARGLETGVSLYGAQAGARIAQAESLRVTAPTRKVSVTSFTATTSSGTPTLSSVSSFTSLEVGMYLTGSGIPSDTYIQSMDSGAGTITMSRNATASASITVKLGEIVTTYGLLVEDVSGVATGGAISAYILGIARFDARVDVAANISNSSANDLNIYSGFSSADGGRLSLLKAANGGHVRARMVTANAEFQVHDDSAVVWSVTRSGIQKVIAGNTQTTVGAAGAASALPGAPRGWKKITIDGTACVIPYWIAS